MNEQRLIVARSRATSKGQTTIPKEVREALGISEGTQIDWVVQGREVKVTAKSLRIADFAGFLGKPPNGRHVTVEEMNEAVLDEAAERFRRKTSR